MEWMTRSGLLDSPCPLKRGRRKATRNLGPSGPPRRGDTLLTVGRDLRQHPGRPSPEGATDIRQAVSTPANIGYAIPARPSPEGATDNKQAV